MEEELPPNPSKTAFNQRDLFSLSIDLLNEKNWKIREVRRGERVRTNLIMDRNGCDDKGDCVDRVKTKV